MARRTKTEEAAPAPAGHPSALLDTRIIYRSDRLDQPDLPPDACEDLICINAQFNSNRDYEVFCAKRSEPRAQASGFLPHVEDRHASTAACIDRLRPRCVELARVLKRAGCSSCDCDMRISHATIGSQTSWESAT